MLALLLWACGGAPAPCGPDAPGGRDACLAAQASDHLAAGDPAAAETALRQMGPGEARDLGWMAYARKTTLPVCGEIADSDLTEHCRSLVGRMHMRETDDAPTAQAGTATPVAGCPPAGAGRERCLEQRARAADTVPAATGFCQALASPDADGACRVDLAQAAGEQDRLDDGIALCGGIPAPRWQSECWFRFSEAAAGATVPQRVEWCRRSDFYADQCSVHLLDQEARRLAHEGAGAPVSALFAGATAHWAQLADAGLDQGMGGDREALFWTQLLHQALRRSVQPPGRPAGAHLSWARALPADRADSLRDLALRAFLHTEAAALTLPEDGLLDAVVAAFDAQAGAAGDGPQRLPPDDPQAARGSHQQTLGRMPWPLAPAAGCTLSRAERDRVVLLWAAASLDHPQALALLAAGSADPAPVVRAYALQAIEDRAFEWDRGGELGLGSLATVLGARAERESVDAVRQRAAALVGALVARKPLPPAEGFGLCQPRGRRGP